MTTDTASIQIKAAGTALAMLTAHSDLPIPHLQLGLIFTPTFTGLGWGVRISFSDDLSQFEQWRQALDIDPATITKDRSDDTDQCWWQAIGHFAGTPVELTGFYHATTAEESE
ncbi:hypothetical protein ACFYNO_25010 [Kitasatospora sp. NPDC006697]|uniref:hypothetical protein n=1 Tax=Kitasatospora sp. NPDC006697 TaxID=3364020 RepID=UPI0036B07B1B